MPPLSPSIASTFMYPYYILPAVGVTLAIITVAVALRRCRQSDLHPQPSSSIPPAEKQPLLSHFAAPPPYTVSTPPPSSQNIQKPSILDSTVPAIPPLATSFLLSLPPPTIRPYEESPVVEHTQPADYVNLEFSIPQLSDLPEASHDSTSSSSNSTSALASRDENDKGKGAVRFGREARLWRGRTGNGVRLCRRDTWMRGDDWGRHVRVIQGIGPMAPLPGPLEPMGADSASATAATNVGYPRPGQESAMTVF